MNNTKIDISDIENYKKCNYNISSSCMGITLKTNFHGKFCNNCYSVKRLEQYTHKKEKKKSLEEEKSQLLTPEQIQKISEIISNEQMQSLAKHLNIPADYLKFSQKPKLILK